MAQTRMQNNEVKSTDAVTDVTGTGPKFGKQQ